MKRLAVLRRGDEESVRERGREVERDGWEGGKNEQIMTLPVARSHRSGSFPPLSIVSIEAL